jgi:hypothetical protein
MIHMTIKGFFKPDSNINRQNLIADLDRYVHGYEPFKIYPGDLRIFEQDRSLEILKDAKDYLSDIRLNSSGYTVKDIKLFEFRSKTWGTDGWIYSLNWKILHTWRLGEG